MCFCRKYLLLKTLPLANGMLAKHAIPMDWQYSTISRLRQNGWCSNWWTTGLMRHMLINLSNCCCEKLQTPRHRTRPASTSFSISFHTVSISPSGANSIFSINKYGKCIIYRSMTGFPRCVPWRLNLVSMSKNCARKPLRDKDKKSGFEINTVPLKSFPRSSLPILDMSFSTASTPPSGGSKKSNIRQPWSYAKAMGAQRLELAFAREPSANTLNVPRPTGGKHR
mmetsp:Transcript_47928/g.145759  ORF Transcript_47928/g.145759 Transcript_47928/m.145759 type:complete len:225 (+) Transcript_47928:2187-2861(+)